MRNNNSEYMQKTDNIAESYGPDNTKFLVKKFLHKGFDSLSPEELASTQVNPDFGPDFKKSTGNRRNA